MSLWKRVSCNPEIEQRMIQYYNEKRLLDLRIYFAQWIEDKIICERLTNPTSEQYERTALQFFEDLKQKLLTSVHENLIKYKIAEIYQNINQTTAVELYTYMRGGLQRESQMLEALSPQSQAAAAAAAGFGGGGVGVGVGVGNNAFMGTSPIMGGGVMPPNCTMHPSGFSSMHSNGEELYPLQARIVELYQKLECFRQNLQQFSIDHDHLRNYLAQLNQSLNPPNDLQLERQLGLVMSQKTNLCMELRLLYNSHDPIQNAVIDELKNWQRNQAKAGNGAPFHDNLDDIQNCIERLVDILCKMDNAIVQLINLDPHNKAELDDLLKHVRGSQRLLYCSAFIVEKQPPQVMKTNTRFAAAVRWLIGPQLGINLNSPTVECVILSEAQAHRQFVQQRNQENPHNSSQPQSGEILNNCSTMEYQQQTRVFSASFRNMQLKKIKRAEKKGTESVMDEKFALLFSTSTVVNDILLRVWTLSLPVVVIVHGNQEPQSWATITWDNAFSEIEREPFVVPDKVHWGLLANALNTKFESATGRGLTADNLLFIYEKLFRDVASTSDQKEYITWAQFCKDPLPDRTFTFWEWFFAIMKLTKDHLLGIWKKGLIVGFINKAKTTDEVLTMTQPGTFLLRFSDSELGSISIAFKDCDGRVYMLSPFSARDLNIIGLADRVKDLVQLRVVYPLNMNRDDAFGEFYTQRNDERGRDGYVPSKIINVLLRDEDEQMQRQLQRQSPNSQEMSISNLVDVKDSDVDIDMYLNGGKTDDLNCDWDSGYIYN